MHYVFFDSTQLMNRDVLANLHHSSYLEGNESVICETKTECDLIWQHYEDLKSLAGPYRFRSQDGKLVAQLNSGLSLETGVSFQTIFEGLDNLTVTNR